MKTIKAFIAIIAILLYIVFSIFILAIAFGGGKGESTLYYISFYDAETKEVVENIESYSITIEETDDYINVYYVQDNGDTSYKQLSKKTNNIKYSVKEKKVINLFEKIKHLFCIT